VSSAAPISPPTTIYRIYCFDGVRNVVTGDLIEASSDEEAIAAAERAGFGTRCEIWEGDRLVAELGGERESA
jgi:hypothetical protein